jgi:hypothetical protein
MIGAIAYPWLGKWAWGIDTACSRFGDDTAPGSSAGRLGAAHPYSPEWWNRYSSTFGFTLWILLPTPLRTADSDLREPISQRPRGRPVLGAVAPPRPPSSAPRGSCHHRHRCHQDTAVPPSVHTTDTHHKRLTCIPTIGRDPLQKLVTAVTTVIAQEPVEQVLLE